MAQEDSIVSESAKIACIQAQLKLDELILKLT